MFKLLPCNSPQRPEWTVLSRMLGRPVFPDPKESEASSSARMQRLLVEAYGKDPKGLVAVSTHRKGQYSNSWLCKLFGDMENSPAAMQDFFETVSSRLLLPEDGRDRQVSRSNAEKGKGSSYRMLEYWEPAKMGMIPYLRARIGHILTEVGSERAEANRRLVSVGRLQDFEQFEGGATSFGEDGDMAHDESPSRLFDHTEAAVAEAKERDDDLPLAEGREALTALLASLQSESIELKPPLFDHDRQEHLTALGVNLGLWHQSLRGISKHGGGLEQHQIRRQAIEEDVARQLVDVLGGVDALPEDLAQKVEDYGLIEPLDAEDGFVPSFGEDDTPDEPAKVEMTPIQLATERAKHQMTARGLASPTRPEYELFSHVLGRRITPEDSPEARAQQLRATALEVAALCREIDSPEDIASGATIEASIAEWNPSTNGFGRVFPDVLDHLERREMEKQQMPSSPSGTPAAAKDSPAGIEATVGKDGQADFLVAMAHMVGSPLAAINALKGVSGPKARRLSKSLDLDARNIEEVVRSPQMQEAFAVRNVVETGFWTASAQSQDDLDSAVRPDYLFLCSKLNRQPVDDFRHPSDVHVAVRAMAQEWVAGIKANVEQDRSLRGRMNLAETGKTISYEAQFTDALVKVTAAYDPAKDGYFSQALTDFMREQLVMDTERRRRGPRKTTGLDPAALNPQPTPKVSARRTVRPAGDDAAALRVPVAPPMVEAHMMPQPASYAGMDI